MTEDELLITDELLQRLPSPPNGKSQNQNRLINFAEDMTERKSAELLLEQKRLLELIACGRPMDECFASVCASVSKLNPGVRACILLTDEQRLKFLRSITPDFPPSFGQGLKNAPINELAIGTCGTAVYCSQPITCADIANDARWSQGWRDLCVAHGVLACHSSPILSMDNQPLGSLMLCFNEARMPTDWEQQLAEFGTQVARIVFEREQSNQALRKSEEKYRTLFNSMGEAFALCEIILDNKGKPFDVRILEVNPAHEMMTGLTTEETIGNTMRRMIPNLDEDLFETCGRVALGGETIRFETYVPSLSRWFDIYAYKVGENDDGKFALIYKDITERKQAEKTLRSSEDRYRTLFKSIDEGFCVIEMLFDENDTPLDYRFLEINPAFEKQTGLEQAQGKTVRQLVPNLEEHWFEIYAKVALTVEPIRFENSSKEMNRWFDVYAFPIGQPQSRKVALLFKDITERKQTELQQQKQARELTQLNHSLMRTTELLAERKQELNSFTYIVSHDLKAPLKAISNLSQWLEDDLKEQLDDNNQRQLQLLRNRVERMEAMIDGLLAYSRVGRTEVESQLVDVGELLNEILDSLDPPPTFTIKIPSELPTIVAKRLLLSQVFSNLISNAIKHHPRPDGQLEISAIQKRQFYEFAIADNGNGIAPENHEKIFGIFQTLNSRDVKESTGVGLSIVKKIVETEGGEITISSELGSGATFRFTWPIQPLTLIAVAAASIKIPSSM